MSPSCVAHGIPQHCVQVQKSTLSSIDFKPSTGITKGTRSMKGATFFLPNISVIVRADSSSSGRISGNCTRTISLRTRSAPGTSGSILLRALHRAFIESGIEVIEGDPGHGRDRVPVEVVLQNRDLAARRPGPDAMQPLAYTAFVDEDDRAPFFL